MSTTRFSTAKLGGTTEVGRELLAHEILALDGDLEKVVPLIDQVQPVEDVGSEEEHLPEAVAGRGRTTQRPAQILE